MRQLSSYQAQWIKKRRLEWLQANGPCRHCGSSTQLEVDHINPEDKVTHRIWSWSKERREAELAKCQVLCKKCHRIKTNRDLSIISSRQIPLPKKLSREQVLEIYDRALKGVETVRAIAKDYGIHHSTVVGIKTGRYWSYITQQGGAA